MKIHTSLSCEEYIYEMKKQMSAKPSWGPDRFNGFFIGKLFYVTRRARFEWNRRITSESYAALGYVKNAEDGCNVHFLRFRGILCPHHFIWSFLFLFCTTVICAINIENILLFASIFSIVISLLAGVYSAVAESFTDNGDECRALIMRLLRNPKDPYSIP